MAAATPVDGRLRWPTPSLTCCNASCNPAPRLLESAPRIDRERADHRTSVQSSHKGAGQSLYLDRYPQ